MKNRLFVTILLFLMGAWAVVPAYSADDRAAAAVKVKFVSGGVGADESGRMAALSKDFNLKLLFAAKDGHYLSDVTVVVSDSRGAKVLDAVSEGPFFFANVAPGKYQVSATYAGELLKRETTVPLTGQRELVFRWAEPAD